MVYCDGQQFVYNHRDLFTFYIFCLLLLFKRLFVVFLTNKSIEIESFDGFSVTKIGFVCVHLTPFSTSLSPLITVDGSHFRIDS